MAAERYLSRRIPDLRVGNNIDEIDKKLIPASIHPWILQHPLARIACRLITPYSHGTKFKKKKKGRDSC